MMNQTLKRDYRRSQSEGIELLVCPNCSAPLAFESMTCPECGLTGREHGDVVSFLPATDGRGAPGPEPDDLEELALLAERRPIREAATEWLDDRTDGEDVRSELFDVGRDAWRMLVADRVSGRCLDVHAGFGRRSMLLSELAGTVYAVDPNLSKLRVTAARDDFESADAVVPVHAAADGLPFANGAFDTIVADATATGEGLRRRLATLEPYLDDGGTLIATVDGWPRRTGLAELAGLDRGGGSAPALAGVRPTPGGLRSLGDEFGFDTVSTYALFPTASRPLYVFDVDNEDAVRTLAEFVFAERALEGIGKPLVSAADRCGILKRCYPSYLVVYEKGARSDPLADDGPVATDGRFEADDEQFEVDDGRFETDDEHFEADGGRFDAAGDAAASFAFTRPMVISGRSRSVILELGDDGPTTVWKIPNRKAHEPLTCRENSVLEQLRSMDGSFTDALPAGEEVDSRFGACRRERPVPGWPLSDDVAGDPDSFERALRLGFEWLIELQRACGGEPVVRTPEQVREELRFAPAGLEPPAIDDPVETFYTPVHGDYISKNVYVDDERVTGVIDWEYGAVNACPIVDAGFLLLDTAAQTVGDFRDGVRTALCSDTEYAARARACVGEYCEALDIPPRTFAVYLPSVYLHRLRLDWRCNATSTYSGRMEDRVRITEFLFEQLDSIALE